VNPRIAFFDAMADNWDSWDDLALLAKRMAAGLSHFGVKPHETVVDVGCGTGNLTTAILAALGGTGKVVAVDISPRMIEVARVKVRDARVTWHVGTAESLPVASASVDRIICFSVWPHLVDHQATLAEFARVLRPGGFLHIWHLIEPHLRAQAPDFLAQGMVAQGDRARRSRRRRHGMARLLAMAALIVAIVLPCWSLR